MVVAGHRHTASRPWPMDRLSVCDRVVVGVGAFRPTAGIAGDVWRVGVAGVLTFFNKSTRKSVVGFRRLRYNF